MHTLQLYFLLWTVDYQNNGAHIFPEQNTRYLKWKSSNDSRYIHEEILYVINTSKGNETSNE